MRYESTANFYNRFPPTPNSPGLLYKDGMLEPLILAPKNRSKADMYGFRKQAEYNKSQAVRILVSM